MLSIVAFIALYFFCKMYFRLKVKDTLPDFPDDMPLPLWAHLVCVFCAALLATPFFILGL